VKYHRVRKRSYPAIPNKAYSKGNVCLGAGLCAPERATERAAARAPGGEIA
jgi:hypothetical protein